MRAKVDDRLPFVEVPLPEPGKPFGPWKVEFPVGQGGFGAVYRAQDPRLGRTIALKVMLDADTADAEDVSRFLREARLAAALEHPNVVRIHDVGTVDGTPYIAMEWIEGTTLGRAKVERPVDLLTTVAETLAFAHERGIVHRDLKPSNVMVERDGRPKLVDFGLAKRIAGSGAGAATFATRDGVVLGTPSYMAPEQELTSAVDARADQWAWAAIAYELLTGARPRRPALAHAALDERLGAVLLRALSIAPSERYSSMRDLLAAWKVASTSDAKPAVAAPVRAPSQAKLFVVTTAAVTCVACLGLALASSWRRVEAPVPSATAPTPAAPAPAPVPAEPELADAEVDASADVDVPAVDAAIAKPRPAVPPGMFVVRALGAIWVEGSSYLDRDALRPQIRAMRPTFERCVIGLTLPVQVAGDPINADVDFRTSGARVRWREFSVSGGTKHGGGEYGVVWPPPSARPCLEAAIRKLKVTPTKEGVDAYCGLRFDLQR